MLGGLRRAFRRRPAGPDITELRIRALEFRSRLNQIKAQLQVPFEWYPYDTFSNFFPLERLLTGGDRCLLDLIGGDTVADFGCGDGGLSFFFESLGCHVEALDYPPGNHNLMRGVRALKAALGSSIAIHELDLDHPPALARRYGLAFLFGVLYHLKNPYGALEWLSERARYCLLSTRVAQLTPDHRTRMQGAPLAYLLDERETNNDATNYWIFSETALRRLLDRTGWDTAGLIATGDTTDSDPVRLDRDERVFCLLRSRRIATATSRGVDLATHLFDPQLGPGWYPPEGGIRWMSGRATLRLEGPHSAEEKLYLSGYCPAQQLALGPLELRVWADGLALPGVLIAAPDESFEFLLDLPAELAGRACVEIVLSVNRTFTPPGDQRELGAALQVVEIR